MGNRKKILIAPLDWGLGHATRCIPVIRALIVAGHEVFIAAEGGASQLLHAEFPGLKIISIPGYRLSYSSWLPAWLKIFLQLPKILYRKRVEHHDLKKIIEDHKIDVVISDNRFGLWNKNVTSVYITHQLMIKCPTGLKFFEPLLHFLHGKVISNFNRCWIPDYEGDSGLAGDLAHHYRIPSNAIFIGPLSRFGGSDSPGIFQYDYCCIISGPEPARSAFEKIILTEAKKIKDNIILVCGQPEMNRNEQVGNTKIVSHLPAAELEKVILHSRKVICRSGYSGIMDLVALKKDAVLIPTPGQTEQEYLAEYLSDKKIFVHVPQKDFSFEKISRENNCSVMNSNAKDDADGERLKRAVEQLKDI